MKNIKNNDSNSNKKLKLVLSYLVHVVDRLSSVYNLSFEDACKAVEDLDLINLYKYDYDFILHENIMTWVDLAYKQYTRNKLQKPDSKFKLKFTGNDNSIDDNDTADTMFNDCKPIVLDNKVKIIMENASPKHVDKNDRLQEGVDVLNDFKLSKQKVKDNLNKILEEQKERLLHYKPEIWYKVYNKQPTTKNTIAGDIVFYDNQIWFNTGNIVAPMQYAGLEDCVDPDGTIRNTKKESDDTNMDNYIMINGTKIELTEEQLNYLCMFNRFAQMAKEQFGLTITPKETVGETFKTLFGVDFSDCSERKNPFNSELEDEDSYFLIDDEGVNTGCYNPIIDKHRLDNINSFNDKDFANQVYLHEILNRKLLKYTWDNEAEDCECDWNGKRHYYIYFDYSESFFTIAHTTIYKNQGIVYFSKEDVAYQAIEDVVKPFIKEHPEFVW